MASPRMHVHAQAWSLVVSVSLQLLDLDIAQDEIKSFKLEYMSALEPDALHISVNPLILLCSTPPSFPYSRLTLFSM